MISNYINEEFDIQFPLSFMSELTYFERQLKETKFKNHVVQSYFYNL